MNDGPDIWGKIILAAAGAVILILVVWCGAPIIADLMKPSEEELKRKEYFRQMEECRKSGGLWVQSGYDRCEPR